MKTLRKHRQLLGWFMTCLMALWLPGPARGATLYWDSDANAVGNALSGTGLGGPGTWNTSSALWWNGIGADLNWNNAGLDTAVFTGTAGAVTLGTGITAGSLVFNSSGYNISGGGNVLTLAGGSQSTVAVNGIGTRATIDAQLSGTTGLLKTGNGVLALSNNSNNFTGNVLVNQGTLVVTSPAQLGGAALVSVNGANQVNNTGGTLVLQGGFAGMNFDKNLSLSGRGLNYANSTYATLANIGQNTISSNIAFSNASTSGIGNAYGNLTLSGTIGLASSQSSLFGLGNGNTIISGQVTGSAVSIDRFVKTQSNLATSVWLTNTANNFVSDVRIDGGTLRVTSNAVLGASISATAIDLNNGTLEVLTDSPDFTTRNVRTRDNTSGGIFVSRGLGGSGLNQTVTFGSMTGININSTFTVTGRDGYNVNIGAGLNMGAGGNGNVTINNSGNGLVTLNTPSLWNSGNTDGSRTLTIGGNGETTLTGIINASPGSSNHNLTKSGTGTFIIQGTASNFRGAANVTGGTLSISSFGAINNNATPGSGALQLNAGALSFTGAATTGAGETVSKAVNLTGTTGFGAILANQSGSSPTALVISNSIAATGAGVKTLFLGGSASSAIVNQVQGVIQNNSGTNTTGLTKVGTSTWLYSPSVTSYGTAPVGVTVTAGGAAQTNSFTVSSATGLAVGQAVSGTNVPAGSIITNINGNVITINNNIGTAIAAATALTFTQNANFTGGLTVGGGTLQVVPAATTGLGSNLFANTQALTFNVDNLTNNGFAGGTFQLGTPSPALTAALTQTMGALTPTAGAGRVQVDTGGASFANTLNFASLGTRASGATITFAPAATNAGIQFAAAPAGLNGQIGGFATIVNPSTGAVDFVATPAINTNIAALGASTVLPATGATATTNYIVNTGVTTTAAQAANTVRIVGGNNLSLAGGALTITSTSATAIGGILHDNAGGASSITGTNLFVSTANGELIVNSSGTTNANSLTIGSVITGNNTATAGTGGLTKSGAGTLILSGANTYTGTTIVNEGTVRLSGSGTLGGTNASLLLRQGTTLDLNGVNVGTSVTAGGLNSFSGAGTITNSAASGAAFIRVGNNNGGGTFSGLIQDGATAKTQFVKAGTGTVSLTGTNTFTGGVVITGGTLAVNALPNFGTNSPIGPGIAGNNAGSIVFNGGGTLQYTGSNANIYQTTQTPSITTDRLFTIDGTGAVTATIDSSGQYGNNTTAAGTANNAALILGNTGAIAFAGTGARTIQLTGNSTGDNEFRPLIQDKTAVTELTGVTKAGAGLWILSGANTYSGPTSITGGALQAVDGVGLPAASNLTLNGGVFQATGSFTRALGTGANQVQFTGNGGFSAGSSKLTVNLGSGATLNLGTAPTAGSTIILSSTTAQADVELTNPINLGTGARTIQVDDNSQSNFDFATVSGVISGGAGGTLTKTGGGLLILSGANTYVGATTLSGGNTVVQSIGAAGATTTNLGTNVGGGALNLGSAATAGNLIYVGPGETTTRTINIAGTTGGASIDSSGSGALVLSSVAVSGAGAKTLTLRGFNTDANSIAGNLNDNGGALAVNKADAGVWELSGTNGFTGTLTVGGGLLGVNAAAALGAAGTGVILFSNGGLYTNTAGGFTIARATQIAANTHATFTGSNPFTLSGTMTGNTSNNWTINNTITDPAGLTISGNFNSAEAATQARLLVIQGTGNTTLSGILQGTGATNGGIGLTINTAPSATTTITGTSANLLSGAGELRSGILILDKAQALGLSTATFDLNGGELRTSATVGAQTQANAFRLNGSPAIINGSNPLTMSGSLTNTAGNRILQNDLSGGAQLTIAAISLSNDNTGRTLTLSGSGTTNVTGVIGNGGTAAGALTYLGTGSLNLTGASTFTGAATFSGGTTTVSGAGVLGATGALAVNQATLTLDNSGTQTNNRLGGRALTLNGATLNVLGNTAGGTEGTVPSTLTIGSGGTTINTTNVGGNTLLAFTTFTTNTGGFTNFTGGIGVANNQVTFSTAPTLVPASTGILARATVNGADFATYGANGIAAFTAYATPVNLNTAAATDTVKVNASTTTSNFTTNKTVNALAFDTGAPTVSNNFGNVLTLTSGGLLATNGAQTLSARTNLAGVEGAIHVGTGASLTLSGVVTGTAGFNKNLAGALNITGPQFITGTQTLNGGTTTLSGGLNTLFPNQTLVVNPGATLNLNGNSQFVGAFGGGNNPGTGGTITSSTAAVFSNNGNVAFGGDISGAITHNKTGGNTLTAESPLTYTGATWITGGTLTLRDNATLLNTSAININYGTLNLDSNANLQIGNNNRVSDTAPLTLRGGTLTYQARFAAQGTETFGALTLAEGASTLNINAANNAGSNAPFLSTDVTFLSLTRNAGATVNITANQGFGNNGNANRVFFTTAPSTLANGMIGGWAIANTTDFAGYDPTLGVGAIGYGGFKGYDLTFAPGNITQFINNATPTSNNLTAPTTTTSALRLGGLSQNDITFSSGSNVLVLESGGLLRSNQAAGSNIGTTASRGVLTAGTGSAAELVIYSAATGTITSAATATTTAGSNVITTVPSTVGLAPGQTITTANLPTGTYIVSIDSPTQITVSQNATVSAATNALVTGRDNVVVNSVIANNGAGAVTLVKSGAGVLNLSANNTYTGGSIFNQGTVNLIGSGVVIPAGGITLNGATLALNTNAGQIASSNAVTLNDSSTLTLIGNNSLNSINFNNTGGTGTPTVTTGGTLTLTNATPISVVSNNLGTVPTVNGTVDFGTGAKTISVGAIQIGGTTLTNIAPALAIGAAILSPGASITKTGNGILQLSGASTFGGGLTVSGGGIVIGANSSPTTGVVTSGPLGTGPVTMAAGTTFLANSSVSVANPVSFAGTPTFDSTATTAWTLTFNGALSGAGLPGGTLSAAVNNPGLTVALLGNLPAFSTVNKTGPGTLIFNATNYSGDFNATALGNPTAVSLLTDGNGTGQMQTLLTGSTVTFDAGIVPNITVGRAGGFGGSSPYILSANKTIAPASISNIGLGLTLTNNSGDGLKVGDSFTTTGTPAYSVANATVSNVVQGLELAGVVTAPTGFAKTGAGTLVLSNTGNSIGGPIAVGQGVLSISDIAQLGGAQVNLAPGTGTSTFRATASMTAPTIQLTTASNTRALEVTAGNTLTFNSAFDVSLATGAGLTKADAGTLALNASNPTWTGVLTISQGAVNILNAGALGTTAGNTVVGASGAALLLPAGMSIAEPLSLTGSGIQSAGALQGAGAGTSTESGAITLAGAAFIGADSGNTLALTGGISGAQALTFAGAGSINLTTTALGAVSSVTKIGSGTTTLGVNSTAFVGGLTVNNGTFVLGSAGNGTLGATGTILVNPTGIFTVDNTTSPVARLGARPVTLAGGTFNYNTNSGAPFTETAGILTLNQGQSTINLTNAGAALTTNTFASLAFGAGATANVTGLNIATSQLKFTTAPTLVPATTGILPRLTVNGNDFATYNATNGIVPFTAYAAATNILSATATQTYRATPATLNSLTGSQTLNALTLDSVNSTAAVGGLGGNPPVTLTLTNGAILAKSTGTGTSSSLNVPIVALGAEGVIHVQSGQTLTVSSAMTGTAGLTKGLAGTLTFTGQQFVSGSTIINGGTVNLASGVTNTLLFNNAVAVNAGGTLNLSGSSQFIAGLSTQAGGAGTDLGGGTVTNTGALSTLTINGNTNFGGVITGNINLNKTGTGALNLQAAQTYTGATLITGGVVNLNDSATLPNTSQPIEIRHGSLALGDGNLISLTNRVSDTAPITLVGGTISVTGRAQTASSEIMGAVTLAGGHSSLTTAAGGTGINSLDVTIASLTRSDATSTIRFNAGGQIGSAARLFITSAPTLTNNLIGAWAVSDREFASYDSVYGLGRLNDTGFANYSAVGIANNPTASDNVRLVFAGTTTLAANTTVNTLTFGQQAAATVLNLGGNTLTVAGGGVMFGQTTDNVDFSITNGSITSGVLNSPSDFFIHHGNFGGTNRTVTLNAPIVDNGTGAVRVIYASGQIEAAGVGITTLTAASTNTGGTVINSGNIVIGTGGALGTGGVTVNNGSLTQNVAGVGIPSQALTLNGGGVVTLAGNNSLTTLNFNNNGGAQPTLNPTGVLTLTTGLNATVSSPGTIASITGGTIDLNANASFPISVGAAVINGVDVAPWQAGLNITSVIQNGGIMKSGAGMLGLSNGTSTFTGGVTVNGGGLVLGASSTPSSFSGTPFYDSSALPALVPTGVPSTVVTSGPLGTGTLTFAANTTLAASTAVTLANTVVINGDMVFNGTNNVTFNGLTTIPSTWNATVTAPQMTVSFADVSGSQTTDVVNKFGPGTLSLSNYNGTLNVGGGLTFLGDGNGLGTLQSISVGGDVNLLSDTSIAVKNASSPNARNKVILKGNLTNNGSIMSVTPLNGYGLEFTGTTTLTGASHFAVVGATASNVVQGLTLSGVVSDSGGFTLVKSGAGTLALTNAGNTFGGVGATIDVLNGVLSASSDGALGNSANSVTLEADGASGLGFRATGSSWSTSRTFNLLQPTNAAFEVTAGTVFTINSPLAITSPTLTINKNDNGILELAADNSAGGWSNSTNGLNITAGAVRLSNSFAAGAATNRIVINTTIGAALQVAGGVTIANPITLNNVANETLRGGINSGGNLQSVSGTNTLTGVVATVFDASFGSDFGSTLNINGTIDNTGGRQITFMGDGTTNINSLITVSPFQINKYGAGTLNFTTAQTVAIGASTGAGLTINAGTVSFNQAGKMNVAAVGGLNVNPGATLEVIDNSASPTINRLGGSALTLRGGNLTITGNTTGTTLEALTTPTFNRGYSIVTLNAQAGQQTNLTFNGANNNVNPAQSTGGTGAMVLFRGTSLGSAAGAGVATITNTAALTFNGSTGAAGTTSAAILPWGIIETTATGTGATAQFATTTATGGVLRPLNTSTEMATNGTFTANVNQRLTANVNVTASVTPNSATLESGGQITISPFQTLTFSSGGILAKTGNNGINGGILSQPAANSAFNIWAIGNMTISSLLNGGNGTSNGNISYVQAGAGTVTLSTPTTTSTGLFALTGINTSVNTLSGQTVINSGTLKLNGGLNTIQASNFLEIGVGGTLDLNGNSQQVLSIFTDGTTTGTASSSGGTITSSTGTGTLVINQDNAARNWAGSITGSVNVTRSGQNTLTIYAPQTYTGTTLINAGTTTLRDTATLSGTSAIDINYATLSADNAAGTVDLTNRINDAAGITLRGGTLTVQGRAQTASSEALGAVSVNQGFNVINPLVGGTGVNSVDVSIASLSRPAGSSATLIVQGTNLGTIGSNSRVTVGTLNGVATTNPAYSANGSGLTNNIVGGWAENGNDFLTYIPGLGLAPLNATGAAQYDLTNTFALGTATKNVRLTATTNIGAGGVNVNAVSMTGSAINLTFTNATDTLNLTSGGLIGPNNNQTIGATVDSGRLTAGGLTPAANSDLYVFNRANTLTINSRIVDNTNGSGSVVRAVFTASGGAITLVNPNNSYTGGTVVNGGTLNLTNTAATAVIPAGGLTINGGTVTMNNFAGQIAATNVVTLNNGNLNLFGNNTLAGLVMNNIGGTGNPTVSSFVAPTATVTNGSSGTLTIGSSGIVATSSNVGTTNLLEGRVDFGGSLNTIQVDPISTDGSTAVAPLQAALILRGVVGSAGGFNKTGTGVLQLNAQAVYTGPTNITAGGIRIGGTNAGSRFSDLNISSGAYLNLAGSSTNLGSLAGAGTVFNSGGAATLTVGFNNNTSTTFSGQLARFNDATVNAVGLTKIGTGELRMTSAQAFATGTTGTITVNGGSIKYVDAGAAFPGTTASGGGTFTVNFNGTLALDNSGTANVNNRLGLNAVGTLNIQGGKLTLNGAAGGSTSETVTTFNVTNGGGRIELTPDAANPLTLALGTLNTANGNGSLVIGGITGAATGAGVANVTITTPNFLGTQGGAANGATTMSVRHDILADASATGLGTGFLVKDSVTNNWRALGTASNGSAAPGELSSTFALPLTTDVDTATAGNQAPGTLNVGLAGSTTALTVSSVANTLTISGTSTVNGLGTAFGNYGQNGALFGLTLSNASASLTLAGATGNINTGNFGSTTAGTTVISHVVAGGTLNVNGFFGVGNTSGFLKAGGGVVNLNAPAYYTGTTTVNDGTLNLKSGQANTLAVIPGATTPTTPAVVLNGNTAILDLNGQSQVVGALSSTNVLPGAGGTVQTTGGAANLTSTGGGNFAGVLAGNLSFTRSGNNTTLLTNASTYSGATIVRGGVLQLRDSGSILNTSSINLQYGTLQIDQSGLNTTANPTRVNATTGFTLQGGNVTLTSGGSVDFSATLGTIAITGGANTIQPTILASTGTSSTITLGNLQTTAMIAAGGTLNFNAAIGLNGINQARVLPTQINGVAPVTNTTFGPNIIVNNGDYAAFVTGQGIGALGQTGFPAYGAALASGAATPTVINSNTAALAIAANTTTGSLKFGTNATLALTFTNGTAAGGPDVLNLALGGLLSSNNANAVNIGTATNRGVITTGGAATSGTFDLVAYQPQNTTTIESVIQNNGAGAVTRLVKSGGGTLVLTGPNTYTGGTIVNQGTLTVTGSTSGVAIIPGDLTINNAAVLLSNTTVTQTVASTSNITINGGGSFTLGNYTNGPTQTFASLTFNNTGGTANPTFSFGTPTTSTSTAILSAANAITVVNDSLATTPTISTGAATLSALQFSNAAPVITTSGLSPNSLNIQTVISGAGGAITKSGTGSLTLSGANTFTTGFNLNQGSLIFGSATAGTPPTITSGPVGTGTLTIAGGTTILADGTARNIGNAVTVNGDFTFGGVTAGNNVTLSGAIGLGSTGRTITVTSPAVTSTISGAITSSASSTALTKAGAGTLVLSNTGNNFNGQTLAVNGGILKNGAAAVIPDLSGITVSAGAGWDLNNFSETVDRISGSGFITQSGASAQTLTVSSTTNSSTFAGSLADNNLGNAASRLNLAKTGAGTTLTLSGVNTYTGTTTVNSGTLQLAAQTALYNNTPASWTAANINVKSGATFAFNVGGTGEFTTGNVTTLLTNLAASSSATNGMNAGSAIGFDTTNAAGGSFTVGDVIANTTGTSGGARGLSKLGTGTLVITGVNTYTGATNVSGGTLQVADGTSGSLATTAVTVVRTGSTIGTDAPVLSGGAGSAANVSPTPTVGVIAGSTIIGDTSNSANRGVLSPGTTSTPGTSNQTLTFTAASTALTVAGGSQLQLGITSATVAADSGITAALAAGSYTTASNYIAINSPVWTSGAPGVLPGTTYGQHDFINVTSGTINLGTRNGGLGNGTVSILNNGYTAQLGDVFNLLDWTGLMGGTFTATTSGNFTSGGAWDDMDLPSLTGGLMWDTSAFASAGVLVVVPEPSRALFLMLGLLGLMMRRRRKAI